MTFCEKKLLSLCVRACDDCDDLEKTNPWILIIMVLCLRSPELCTEIRVDSLSGLLLLLALINLLLAHNIRFEPIYKVPTSQLCVCTCNHMSSVKMYVIYFQSQRGRQMTFKNCGTKSWRC